MRVKGSLKIFVCSQLEIFIFFSFPAPTTLLIQTRTYIEAQSMGHAIMIRTGTSLDVRIPSPNTDMYVNIICSILDFGMLQVLE